MFSFTIYILDSLLFLLDIYRTTFQALITWERFSVTLVVVVDTAHNIDDVFFKSLSADFFLSEFFRIFTSYFRSLDTSGEEYCHGGNSFCKFVYLLISTHFLVVIRNVSHFI